MDWLGEPDTVRRVSSGLLLYEWYARDLDYYSSIGWPVPGLEPTAGFFVKPDGTVVGPACWMDGVVPTNVDQVVSILGPPTRLRRHRFFDAYTWTPRKKAGESASGAGVPVLEMRLSLSVDKIGWVRTWS